MPQVEQYAPRAVDVQISVKKVAAGIITATVELAKDMAEGAALTSRLKVVELRHDQNGDLARLSAKFSVAKAD